MFSAIRRSFQAGVLLAATALGLDLSKLQPSGYVNDFAHAIDAQSARAVTGYCGNLERLTGVQVAVVTIDTLDGDAVEDVAAKLYQQWGIGKKQTDEGLLLLLVIHDRKQRVEVGYGLEPVIPDGFAGGVLRGIRPILRQGNYGAALLAALQQFGDRIAQAKGVDLGTGAPRPRTQAAPVESIPWPLLLLGLFFLLALFGRRGGRRGGGWGGGGGFLPGLILGNLLSRAGGRSGWSGGGFGGYDSGGGFGGFGGGSSGGGGASSDW
jgi:uncharacterized protein